MMQIYYEFLHIGLQMKVEWNIDLFFYSDVLFEFNL